MSELKVFNVIYHTSTHEMSVSVVAKNRVSASKTVNGAVMDVSEGESIYDGYQFGRSGWNKLTMKPRYKSPSSDWVDYLKSQNTNEGFED